MNPDLSIVIYPDPRLRKASKSVLTFDKELMALAHAMLQTMRTSKGVGLAAPQVGKNIRLFVMNPNGEPDQDRVYVNPVLTEAEGEESDEEGCLSIPDLRADIPRSKTVRLDAQDLQGNPIVETQSGYIARIWQHEIDHLNGTLIIDRMGSVAKMAHRKKLKDMEEQYAAAHPSAPARPTATARPAKKRKAR